MQKVEKGGQGWLIPGEQNQTITPIQHLRIGVGCVSDRLKGAFGRSFPSGLRRSIEGVAGQNGISRWDVVRMLREERNPVSVAEIRKKYQDRTRYYGCIHGASPEFVAELEMLASGPSEDLPDLVVLAGDLPGAVNQRTIRQKLLFYNNLMNDAGPILKANPKIAKEELLNTTINDPQAENSTIRDGAVRLLRFALEEMAGFNIDEVDMELAMRRLIQQQIGPVDENILAKLDSANTDTLIDLYIRWISDQKLNSGTWVGTLPLIIRQRYIDQYKQAAEELSKPILKLKERGVDMLWVEGNEDMKASLDVMTEGLDRVFDTQKYFEGLGIPCRREISGHRGKATYHILIPYKEILNYDDVPADRLSRLKAEADRARAEGLEIIMVAHTQLDWGRHYPGKKATGYNAATSENLARAVNFFQPHELVYPHQHWEMPEVPDRNAKYAYHDTVVTYLPLLSAGELDVPASERIRESDVIFTGKRQPVRRII